MDLFRASLIIKKIEKTVQIKITTQDLPEFDVLIASIFYLMSRFAKTYDIELVNPINMHLQLLETHPIVQSFGIEHNDEVALRGSFLIDKEGIVQHAVINNLPLGRNVDEMLRLVDALQFSEQHGEVCPAGWQKGAPGVKPTSDGVADYLANNVEAL